MEILGKEVSEKGYGLTIANIFFTTYCIYLIVFILFHCYNFF